METGKSEKIRRQYFNFVLVICLALVCMALSMLVFGIEVGTEVEYDYHPMDIFFYVIPIALPCFILSMLNRRFFGKIICELNENGILFREPERKRKSKDFLIPWHEIKSMTFHPTVLLAGMRSKYAYIDVKMVDENAESIQISHAPLYMLKKAKNYNKNIKTSIEKRYLAFIFGLVILVPPIVALFV